MKILQHEDCRALNQGGAKSLDLEYNKTAWHGLKWSLGSRPLRKTIKVKPLLGFCCLRKAG